MAEGGNGRHADQNPDHLLPPRGRHGDRYPDYEPTEMGRARGPQGEQTERVVRRKERPARPPQPQSPIERDVVWDRERDKKRDRDRSRDLEWDQHMRRDQRKDREQDFTGRGGGRDGERSRDRGQSGDRHRARDRQRQNGKDGQRARTRSRERNLDEDFLEHLPREGRASWEEEEDDVERMRRARGRQRVHSGPEEVFEEHRRDKGRGDHREFGDPWQGEGPGKERSRAHCNGDTGTTLSSPPGSVGAFVWCAGVAFRFADPRWWVDLMLKSLMKTLLSSLLMMLTISHF